MTEQGSTITATHSHSFLGAAHEQSERKTWAVIWLCTAMMVAEIIGGLLFGSIALVADGLHMSTHAGALLLAALAYSYARKHVADPRFSFGTGKLGDLAGFTSAIVLAMIAILIGYEAVARILAPVPIHFAEAIPIACLGLAVNVASVWLLGGDHHGHDHGHDAHDHDHDHDDEHGSGDHARGHHHRGHHSHRADHQHANASAHRDHNMRAALIHVFADAAVSVLVIIGLSLAYLFGWLWMDPLAGIAGAVVIASWSVSLIRDTAAILLDMNPDRGMAERLRRTIEAEGDSVADLHLWRLGPGHLGVIISVCTRETRDQDYYRARLAKFPALSHLTIEVRPVARA
jgi:cation diffusion facilitator family transporter